MNNPQPTYEQAAAFLRAAYTLKESLSADYFINVEVDNQDYGITIFKREGNDTRCVGCSYAFLSLFSDKSTLTEEQNTKAINRCIKQAHQKIAELGDFKNK